MLQSIRSQCLGLILLAIGGLPVAQADPQGAQVTPLMSKPLAGLEDKEGLMLMVEYPPGGVSQPHRHNASVFVYVLQGTVVMQVAGSDKVTLSQGETFHEKPDDIHIVSRNPSETEKARMLVFFVKERGNAPTVPVDPSPQGPSR